MGNSLSLLENVFTFLLLWVLFSPVYRILGWQRISVLAMLSHCLWLLLRSLLEILVYLFVFIRNLSFLPGCFKRFWAVLGVLQYPYDISTHGFIFFFSLELNYVTCNSKAHATSWTGIPLIQVPINSFPDHPRGKGEQTPPIIRSRTFGVSLLIYCCGLRVLSWCPRISLPPFLSFFQGHLYT